MSLPLQYRTNRTYHCSFHYCHYQCQ
jgi:hypothetical protein